MKKTCITVNKKFIYIINMLVVLTSFSCSCSTDSPSTINFPSPKQEEPELTLLEKQIRNVRNYISTLSQSYLVLGVSNEESDINERFNSCYIFLNDDHKDLTNKRILSVNFNNLKDLEQLANGLNQAFDKIILDDSCFKFTDWYIAHIEKFKKLLKSGGKFIFGPSLTISLGDFKSMSTQEEIIQHIESIGEVARDSLGGRLAKGEMIPFMLPMQKGAYKNEIQDLFDKYKQIQSIKDENLRNRKHKELGLPVYYTDEVLKDDNKLKNNIERRVNLKHFKEKLLKDVIVPKNHVYILEKVFGKGNIQVEYDQPLPFRSHCTEKQEVLITATRSLE
ncbi:MAG: class I SAM-dependent methyltransferase [Candidatus Amoebophilus sp.]